MKNIRTQIKLYNKRNQIHSEMKPIRFDQNTRSYLKKLMKIHKKSILTLFGIIFVISLVEVGIPLILNIFLEKFNFQLGINNLYYIIGILFFVLVVYIILNYFSISKQKKLILDVINKIREDWLKIYLKKSSLLFSDRDKGNLFVKVTYHLSLLQTGLNNSFFVFFQWGLYLFGILIVTSILDMRLLLISLAFIPINAIVFVISYIFSSYYLAKDQTLYSKLLRYISDTFNTFNLIKALKKEKDFIKNVEHIVELDNYFRIKREIVLRLGNKIIFVVLTLISAGIYLINIYTPFFNLDTQIATTVQILIFALHLKLIYLSLRMGLFYFPLKLGLFLCVPKFSKIHKSKKIDKIESLVFKARKVKLKKDLKYSKNVSFVFEKGKKYLLRDVASLNNDLLNIFAGVASKSIGRNWVVRLNKTERLLYNQWSFSEKSIYYINPNMYTEVSIFQFLNEEHDIELLKKFKEFNFIFEKKKFLGSKINRENFNFSEICILQIAYCLILKPELVVIDSLLCDLQYKNIQQALKILKTELHNSIFISFTHLEKTQEKYDVVYTI